MDHSSRGRRRALLLTCLALTLLAACAAPAAEDPPEEPPATFQYRDRTMTVREDLPGQGYLREGYAFDETGRASYTWRKRSAKTGIDVSYYQKEIDWEAVAADGIEFAMIRLGFRGYTEGGIHPDKCFEANYAGARAAGLEVGVYFFSQAVTPEEAEAEAQFVLDTLAGRPLDYPVAFDWETIAPGKGARTDGMDGAVLTQCALAFGEKIRAAGYQPAVYFYQDLGYMTYDLAQMQELVLWLAEDGSAPDFYYHFDWWQYTSSGQVAGIDAAVDLDLDLRGLERPARPGKSVGQARWKP